MMAPTDPPAPDRPKRRVRYQGKNPRRFDEKYKEHDPVRYAADVAKVVAGGKTPAGSHRPIMVAEILEALALQPGGVVVDCTLGYGGHARELLAQVAPRHPGIPSAAEAVTTDGTRSPGATFSEVTAATTGGVPQGRLIGLDVDPIEQPKTLARLRDAGFGEDVFTPVRRNFAGLPQVLAELGIEGADAILADLGVSSMQLDDPSRGFTFKDDGPLDLRLNPQRPPSASDLLASIRGDRLEALLAENSDEPDAATLAREIVAVRDRVPITRTRQLADALRGILAGSRLSRGRDADNEVLRETLRRLKVGL